MTLPFAMIGPELIDADAFGSRIGVSHTGAPVRASIAYMKLSELPSMSVVPQIAMLRLLAPRPVSLRRTSHNISPDLASTRSEERRVGKECRYRVVTRRSK